VNVVFYAIVLVAFAAAGLASAQGPETMAAVGKGALDGARAAVMDVALPLAGAMTLFLGLMKVVEKAGGLDFLARLIRPVLVRLFPSVPADHPAMGAMVMNLAANVLGLGNAATPFGIKAMQELETLNKHPGVATDAMVLFLAINTSGVAVLPTGMIAIRANAGSMDPASIFVPTLLATSASTLSSVAMFYVTRRLFPPPTPEERHATQTNVLAFVPVALAVSLFLSLVYTVWHFGEAASAWIVPSLIFGMLTIGVVRGVKVYETFVEGARDGFLAATRIIPFLVGILAVVGMFRASGAMDLLTRAVTPICRFVGFPPEVLPLALLRPLSGSGAMALSAEMTRTFGPDTFLGNVAATVQGSTETTFYVLAVYFGAVGVTRIRNAVICGLTADIVGALVAAWSVRILVGQP
jgi:spore maturation protein SpmA